MDPDLTQQVEAVLFVSGRFMDASRIAELVEQPKAKVKRALELLREDYGKEGSALQVLEEDGAWKIHVRDEFLDLVSKVISDTEVSGPVLETLAIVAWRSPILQSEVINIRGTNAYEHVKELVDREFITKEPKGRSYTLKITEKFFDYFDIEGRDDIRKLFKSVEEQHRAEQMENELEQKRLEKAMEEAQEGHTAVIDMPHAAENQEKLEQETMPDKKMDIDDLDKVLEKSKLAREKFAENLDEARKRELEVYGEEDGEEQPEKLDKEPEKKEDEAEKEALEETTKPEETEQDDDIDLEEAKKIREQVEKDIDDISK